MSSGRCDADSDHRQRQDPHRRSVQRPRQAPSPFRRPPHRCRSVRSDIRALGRRPDANHRRRRPAGAARLQRRTRAFHRGAEELVGVDLRGRATSGDGRRVAAHARSIAAGRVDQRRLLGSRGLAGQRLPTRNADRCRDAEYTRCSSSAWTATWRSRTRSRCAAPACTKTSLRRRAAPSSATRAAGSRDSSRTRPWTLVTRAIPPLSADGLLAKARAALRHAAALGVTSIQDMTASADGVLGLRGTARVRRADGAHLLDAELRRAGIRCRLTASRDWLRIGGRKLFSDGSMGSSTAAFFEPYSDDAGNGRPAHARTGRARAAHRSTRTRTASSSSSTRSATAPTRSSSTSSSGCVRGAAGRPAGGHESSTRRRCGATIARASHARRHRLAPAEPLHRRHALGGGADRRARAAQPPTTSGPSLTPGRRSRSAPTGSSRRSTRCSASTPR